MPGTVAEFPHFRLGCRDSAFSVLQRTQQSWVGLEEVIPVLWQKSKGSQGPFCRWHHTRKMINS